MITKTDARKLVKGKFFGEDFTITQVDEHPWGWVFFYESKRFLATENGAYRLVGNNPYAVNKNTCEVKVVSPVGPVSWKETILQFESETGWNLKVPKRSVPGVVFPKVQPPRDEISGFQEV